ncbi:DUF5662 family protein [Catellicoccus marimammalium]|uniref:Catalase n=1 Tax=Catellicoccus marimammalium M35/04/3 TaxID=1234409 RepID=K8ZB89_9ENTE|nr:DUF5662 family protein [Catellicoccus marimammalium]EKU27317.1 hypothetical protein C683_0648 [Catellicoccus marimammalium M35/04/3]
MTSTLWNHLKTITHHRHLVMKNCFRCGLYKRGLLHDLSKYSPQELYVHRYWTGTHSPIHQDKVEHGGCSKAWLHHKGHNAHHLEYWLDNSKEGTIAQPMTDEYLVELLCDRIGASKNYLKDKYTDASPYEYNEKTKHTILTHLKTAQQIHDALYYLKEVGEDQFFKTVREELKRKKKIKK